MDQGIQRNLGLHEARIAAIEQDIHEIRDDLRQISTTLSQVRGGWKVLVFVLGLTSAAVGAAIMKLFRNGGT